MSTKIMIQVWLVIGLISVLTLVATSCREHVEEVKPVGEVKPVEEVWTVRHDGEVSGFDYAKAITVDNTGNVYVVGDSEATRSGSPRGLDIVSIKYSSDGKLGWLNRYTSIQMITNADGTTVEANAEDRACSIAVDSSGNVYVAGMSYEGNGWDYVLIKYDASGHKVWEVTYSKGTGSSEGTTKMLLDVGGNIYISGTRSGDFTTIKYDRNGEIIWAANYNGWAKKVDICNDMAIDDKGNVYVVGESAGLDTNRDYATVKYDSNGKQIWVSRYDRGFSSDVARRVAVDKEGNVYVAGTTGANTGWATIKYDSEGGERWVATFDGQGRTAITTGIAVVASGNVYVTGWVGGGGTNADIVTIKYDTNGKMIWQRVFDESGDDYAYAMALDKWDNIYITGTCSQGKSPGQSGSSYVTLKYDRDGNQKWVAYSFGPHRSSSHAIVLDNDDNVYVTGTDYGSENYNDYATVKYSQIQESPTPTQPQPPPQSTEITPPEALVYQQQPSQELKFTKVTAAFSVNPEEQSGFHIPQGSVIYHWANGITEVYGPDNTRILIAKDSEAAQIPVPTPPEGPPGPLPATHVYSVPNGTLVDTDESGKITRMYLSGTLILTIIEKDENYPID